jgi:hypothetical protein
MTKIARMAPTIPRGTVIGKRTGGLPLSEADHFHKCEACGRWFDMRDLGAVLDHEEALPHPGCDQVQWLKKIRPRFPEARSHTARDVRPAVLPAWFHIVMAVALSNRRGELAPHRSFLPDFFFAIFSTSA